MVCYWLFRGQKGGRDQGNGPVCRGVEHVQSQGLLLSLLKRPKLFTSVLNHLLQIEVKAPTCKENTRLCLVDSVGGVTKTLAGQLWGREGFGVGREAGLCLEAESPLGSGQCVNECVCVCKGLEEP